jgi:adenine-specific DNA-methyltransferase
MKFKTVGYKGSKRKLLEDIGKLVAEVEPITVLDGFSGSGIVSAYLRSQGYFVFANDKMSSCNLFSRVFLYGFNEAKVKAHLDHMNKLKGVDGWFTKNYSGEKTRLIKGIKKHESRPLGFTKSNAKILDEARDYAETIKNIDDKNAVVFSIILAMNSVFNNSNDQKSCLKEWTKKSLTKVKFEAPTLVQGRQGLVYTGDVTSINKKDYDVVYLDPPYTNGVLYDSCYHLNDSMCLWDKPALDYDFAIPRPQRAIFRKNKKTAGAFYSKKKAEKDFKELLNYFDAKRIILSYSDAPRNIITKQSLIDICENIGDLKLIEREHQICSQAKSQKKVSKELKAFFFVIDKTK